MLLWLSSCSQLRVTKHGFIIGMLFSAVLLNEWLLYVIKAMEWPVINDVEENSVRVLIAADPQILSLDSEPLFPFNMLTTWDADRFVSRGFHLAVWRTKPEIVVFLGDVLDDGSVSTDEAFYAKANHFRSLMYIPSTVKHTIYVPGDNDIGGEGLDKVTEHKVQRFYSAFNQSSTIRYKFIDFTQMRAMDEFDIARGIVADSERIRILLSHFPLLPMTGKKIKERMFDHHPSFIFSAHNHDSFHFIGIKNEPNAQEFWPLREEGKIYEFDVLSDILHEVGVPTCSYRMGKKSYGYGFAIIGKSGLMQYNVLWLPSRFAQLWLYLTCLGIAFLIYLPSIVWGIKHLIVRFSNACGRFFIKCPKYHRL